MANPNQNHQQTIDRIAQVLENAHDPLKEIEECRRYLRQTFGPNNHHVQAVLDQNFDAVNLRRDQLRSMPSAQLEERNLNTFVLDPAVPSEWVSQRNQESNEYMKHLIAMSFLMEDRHTIERNQFLNARLQRLDEHIETPRQLQSFWANTIAATESSSLLRAAAPKAYAEATQFINDQRIDNDLSAISWNPNKLTPGMREDLKIQKAFANRVDPVDGNTRFRDGLKSMKDHFMRGIGDKRVALGISGTLLGLSVMAGTGPAGIAIGSLRLGAGLLSTKTGKQFQEKLFSGAKQFFGALGIKPEVLDKVGNTVSSSVETALASKWGKRMLMGAVVGAIALGSIDTSSVPAIGIVSEPPVLPNEIPGVTHEVVAGDTLSKIAKAHVEAVTGQTPNNEQIEHWVKAIQIENQIADKNVIFTGQQLSIPVSTPDLLPSQIDEKLISFHQLAATQTPFISHAPGGR